MGNGATVWEMEPLYVSVLQRPQEEKMAGHTVIEDVKTSNEEDVCSLTWADPKSLNVHAL